MIKQLDFTMENVFQLVEIEKTCFKSSAWSIHAIQGEFNLPYSYFLAEMDDDGKILGYVSIRTMYEEGQFSNVAVLPEYRKQGIGKRLVSSALDLAKEKGCTFAELEVNFLNEPAKKLYESCGFTVAGVRKNFYRKSDYGSKDAYTMTIRLVEDGQ